MNPFTLSGLKELLAEWAYLLTFGLNLDIYAKGSQRVGIGRTTGETVIEYSVACRGNHSSQSKSICGITV